MSALSTKISVPAAFGVMVVLALIVSSNDSRHAQAAKPKANNANPATVTVDTNASKEEKEEQPVRDADPYSSLRNGVNRHWVP